MCIGKVWKQTGHNAKKKEKHQGPKQPIILNLNEINDRSHFWIIFFLPFNLITKNYYTHFEYVIFHCRYVRLFSFRRRPNRIKRKFSIILIYVLIASLSGLYLCRFLYVFIVFIVVYSALIKISLTDLWWKEKMLDFIQQESYFSYSLARTNVIIFQLKPKQTKFQQIHSACDLWIFISSACRMRKKNNNFPKLLKCPFWFFSLTRIRHLINWSYSSKHITQNHLYEMCVTCVSFALWLGISALVE